ncbi:MAG: M23 family metallopeptidase [Flavobacteriaceae bacterium]|jgi:murein DD-endopeptidase MepM/ murein hydrolase activator NlpD
MTQTTNKPKKKSLVKRFLAKYRLVVLNEDTFEELLSYKLSRFNVFLIVGLSAIFLISATYAIIALTPLREYIPGYDSTDLRRQAVENTYILDSLQHQLERNQRFIASFTQVLTGDLKATDFEQDSLRNTLFLPPTEADFVTSTQDSILRQEVAREDRFNLLETAESKVNFVLFTPATGTISQGFDPATNHFAVDVVVAKNTPIKAAASGTVIFADWTTETGYVVIIKHAQNIVSVYKHSESLAVSQGDLVVSGEVIAFAGSTGNLSTGPHLHFELWSDGYPIDPTEFIEFE